MGTTKALIVGVSEYFIDGADNLFFCKNDIIAMQGLHKTVFAKAPAMGKIWRDFGHAFSFASSSSRGMYPSPSYLIWMCCTRFPLDLSGAST